jgi:hypothetical protein
MSKYDFRFFQPHFFVDCHTYLKLVVVDCGGLDIVMLVDELP